jgi:hypothetical protein
LVVGHSKTELTIGRTRCHRENKVNTDYYAIPRSANAAGGAVLRTEVSQVGAKSPDFFASVPRAADVYVIK